MTVIGYARVSTIDQNLELQETALRAAGCDIIRAEKVSGTSREGRTELETVLAFLGKGDTLLVTRIDRLARSIGRYRPSGEGKGSFAPSYGTTNRHQHRSGEMLPRYAWSVCRV
jgi:hypothetical protein